MLVYRIGHKNYVGSLSSSGASGRWASAGRMVIYCGESIPLAFLENMVRRQGVGFNSDFRIAAIDIPDELQVDFVNQEKLEIGWRAYRDYSICQKHGDKWYDAKKFPVLKVPSSVLPSCCNFIINTTHKDFEKIKIIGISDLVPDERIEDILRNYKRG